MFPAAKFQGFACGITDRQPQHASAISLNSFHKSLFCQGASSRREKLASPVFEDLNEISL
jgi:hypothetical protein